MIEPIKQFNNLESEKPENFRERERERELKEIEELQKIIEDSPKAIENELSRGCNPWLACFGTRTFVLNGVIRILKFENKISLQDFKKFSTKLLLLENKAYESREKYGWNPPDEFKQELLKDLQNIME